MKNIAIATFGFLIVIVAPQSTALQAQAGQNHRIEKWNLKHSCMELRLEPTELVTGERTPGISSHFSSSCIPGTDAEVRAKQADQALPGSISLQSITAVIKEVVAQMPVKNAMHETLSGLEPKKMLDAAAGAMAPYRGVRTHNESLRIFLT